MKVAIFLALAAIVACEPHYPYPGHPYPGHPYPYQGHQHHRGCNHHHHSSEEQEKYKYPVLLPVLGQLESGRYSPNQMKEMQDDFNGSVQKGIQAWNKRGLRDGEGVEDVGDPFSIDIRRGNVTESPTSE